MANQESAPPSETITKALLEETIRAASNVEDVEVLDFTSASGSKKGDNYASTIIAVDVNAKVGGSEKTFNFIVKEIPSDPTRKKYMEDSKVFPKEVNVYTVLHKAMLDIQKRHGVKNPVKVEAPELYKYSLGDDTKYLIFNNLVKIGYKMADKYAGLDYDHCRLALTELGKYHAYSYALKLAATKPIMEEYPFLDDIMINDEMEKMFGPFFENSYENMIKIVSGTDAVLAEKMRKFSGEVYQICKTIRLDGDGLDLILHGDFWVNNMIFKYETRDGKEVPVGVKLLDFQVARYGAPTLDLTYFLYTSTPYNLHKNHLQDLLKIYHDSFTNALKSMGLEFPEFSLKRLQEKYEKDRLMGFFFGCMALPLMMARPEDTLNMDDLKEGMDEKEMATEFASRMEDSLKRMKDNDHFQDRVIGIVRDIDAAGLFDSS